jgi:hypothetical protein
LVETEFVIVKKNVELVDTAQIGSISEGTELSRVEIRVSALLQERFHCSVLLLTDRVHQGSRFRAINHQKGPDE